MFRKHLAPRRHRASLNLARAHRAAAHGNLTRQPVYDTATPRTPLRVPSLVLWNAFRIAY